jgi:hypothetical protein
VSYFERGRQKVLNEPKLDATFRVLDHTQDHDRQEPLVQVSRRNREDVDVRLPFGGSIASSTSEALEAARHCG